jgi:hypothetical protein
MARDGGKALRGERSLTWQLKGKGRARRETMAHLSASGASARLVRNDVLPSLALIQIKLDDLRRPSRRIRKVDPAHVRDVAGSISALGFCAPVLVGRGNEVLDGEIRVEAAKLLGLPTIPCVRVDHLTEVEQRVLRLAVNRLAEKGEWDLDELKVEFEDLILEEAPIEISGFTLDEIDHVTLDHEAGAVEDGPLAPEEGAVAIARVGDVFQLGPHRVICGDATDPAVIRRLMEGDTARLILTDEPYNVPVAGHVTGGDHREFAMVTRCLSRPARRFSAWLIGESVERAPS